MFAALPEWVPWILASAGAVALAYEHIVGKNIWRNVAEGRGEQIDDLEKRLIALEAKDKIRDELWFSSMAETIANKVLEEIDGSR